jgi:hypothetical protein
MFPHLTHYENVMSFGGKMCSEKGTLHYLFGNSIKNANEYLMGLFFINPMLTSSILDLVHSITPPASVSSSRLGYFCSSCSEHS